MDIKEAIQEALLFLRSHPLLQIDIESLFTIITTFDYSRNQRLFPRQPLLINLCDIHSLSRPLAHAQLNDDSGINTVAAWSEEIVMGKFLTRKLNSMWMMFEIQLCWGLQKDTMVSVLVHEMLHAVFCLYSKYSSNHYILWVCIYCLPTDMLHRVVPMLSDVSTFRM